MSLSKIEKDMWEDIGRQLTRQISYTERAIEDDRKQFDLAAEKASIAIRTKEMNLKLMQAQMVYINELLYGGAEPAISRHEPGYREE